jgi:hypothetical protein
MFIDISLKISNINPHALHALLLEMDLVDFKSRRHGLLGLWPVLYDFNKKRPISCNVSAKIVNPIMNICKMAESEFPNLEKENYTHCSIAIYHRGGFVSKHTDNEKMHLHFRILSISLGDTVDFQLERTLYPLHHGHIVKFDGMRPHSTLPLQGNLRINLTFREWKK